MVTRNWIVGIVLSIALLLAGSDGEWFPWPNLVGGVMLIFVVWWVNAIVDRKEFQRGE